MFQEYLNKRHEIIDRCDRGILTESQRDRLLDKVDSANSEYFEAAVEIGKLRIAIERAYEDYTNGSITLGQREKVIGVVKDRIATITESVDVSFNDRYASYISSKELSDEAYAREYVDYLYENRYIMESEALELMDIIDTDYTIESLDDDISDMKDSIFSEGANLDARRAFKTGMKEINIKMKKLKKMMKSRDFTNAKKLVSELMNDYNKLQNDIKECKDGSALGSYILGSIWVNLCASLRTMLLCCIPVVGYATATLLNIKESINYILIIIENIKKAKNDEITSDVINLYKNKLLIILKNHVKILKKIQKEIDNAEKNSSIVDDINTSIKNIATDEEE